MSLTRRNVAAVGEVVGKARGPAANGTIWEQEANDYWKEMEPAKRQRRIARLAVQVALVLAAVGGMVAVAQLARTRIATGGGALEQVRSVADGPPTVSSVSSEVPASSISPPSTAAPHADALMPASVPSMPAIDANPVFSNNQAAVDLLRARCRVRGVQTRWHEETCRKLCVGEVHNAACMNGCSYGSITVTKLTCEEVPVAAIPTETQCPDGVSCKMACRAYDNERPFPDLRNTCERACAAIVPSSCTRILQIQRDLYRGTLQ